MKTHATKYEVKEIAWSQKQFLTKREKVKFDKLPDFFTRTYGILYKTIGENKLQSNEPPCAIYYSMDEAKKETEVAAAVPVQGTFQKIQGFEKVVIPSAKALQVIYSGPYDEMKEAYDEMDDYLKEHHLKRKWIIEQYLSDPAKEKDPNKMRTDIYFILE